MSKGGLKKTVLNEWHRANGGKMVDFGGWDMPLQYGAGILREHLATRKFGGMFDVSHMGRFRIKGKDRLAFLQRVLSNNVDGIQPWQAQYNLVPNEAGGVIDDVYLYRFGRDDYLLVVNAGNRERVWSHFEEQKRSFGSVTIEDETDSLAMTAFQGPLSGRILERLISRGGMPEPAHNSLSKTAMNGVELLVARTGYTGEPIGFELFVPSDAAEGVWATLLEEGARRGVLPVGLGARDTLRLEAGMPLYGHEFGVDLEGKELPAYAFPLAGIAVSFSERKGAYIGREALAAQFEEVRKLRLGKHTPTDVLPGRFRPVALEEGGVMRRGNEVFVGEKKAGWVSSGTVVPYWEFEGSGATMTISDRSATRSIGLAYLDAGLGPDQELGVVVHGRRRRARVVRWHGRSEAPPYFRSIPSDRLKQASISVSPRAREAARGKVELLLSRAVENHEWRQRRCVNLIPSEMTPSPLVRLLQISDPVGRYAEHKELLAAFGEDVYYYQGTDFIQWVEQRLAEEMADYMGCSQVEVRTISGQMANVTIFSAFVDYKNRTDLRREAERIRLAFTNHIGRGGHLSSQPMGALRDFLAKDPVTERHAVTYFPVCRDNPYRIDLAETAKLLERETPELMILGKSMVLHPEPVSEIRRLVSDRKHPPIIMYDMAHVFGLLGPHFQEPFKEGVDLVSASSHKTFFGTQRGVIGGNFREGEPEYDLWKAIQRRAFPGMVSNHHLGTLLGLLMAALEMQAFKTEYQRQVISNAKALARALKERGLDVQGDPASDYTETHQVIVGVGYARGCEVARFLEDNNIIVNYQALPYDESFTSSSGLRLGVAEMTRFGMNEPDFAEFGGLFADAVSGKKNVKEEVARFRGRFQAMRYCFDDAGFAPLKKSLLGMLG